MTRAEIKAAGFVMVDDSDISFQEEIILAQFDLLPEPMRVLVLDCDEIGSIKGRVCNGERKGQLIWFAPFQAYPVERATCGNTRFAGSTVRV